MNWLNDLSSAIAVRAAHGMVGAALSSLGLYYMVQAFPAKWRMKALVLGLGTSQLALPLARLFSEDLLQIAERRGLYLAQRVPVRITVDANQAQSERLLPGMSVVVSIDTSGHDDVVTDNP